MMNKNSTGIALLKKNLDRVEEKYLGFFERGAPRWPSEERDYLHNHHQSLSQFFALNISLEKLNFKDLPEDILRDVHAAFEAFKNGQEYV